MVATKKTFVKINADNNWENITYRVDGKEVVFPSNIHVKWPNGKISIEDIVSKKKYGTYQDMGHTYDYSTIVYHIKTKYNGITIFIPIEDVKVDESALKFK